METVAGTGKTRKELIEETRVFLISKGVDPKEAREVAVIQCRDFDRIEINANDPTDDRRGAA